MPNDSRLIVPALDDEPWPTLGFQVADFIQDLLVHGPGDLLGEDIELTDEELLFLARAYEVYPRGHRLEGRRRFKRCVLSRRKGVGKTEVAALIAVVEMDPAGPVRFGGWDAAGDPVGRPVRDPYIPMVATTLDQTEDLAFGAVHAILSHERCGLYGDYEVGLEKIVHRRAPGTIQPMASAPSSRDGARTTWQHFDETHLFTEPRLVKSHATMQRNIPKRKAADPWSLETTTMYAPGEGSVAEGSHKYALRIAAGTAQDPTLYFDHRQASERHDLDTKRGLRAALLEASGDAAEWTDLEAAAAQYHDPQVAENDFRRYWLNQARKGAGRWLPAGAWSARADRQREVPDGASIVLGFKGSYTRGGAILVACTTDADDPHLFVVKAWERPFGVQPDAWRVPREDVKATVETAMNRWAVAELAGVPYGWRDELEQWTEAWPEQVLAFDANQPSRLGPACDDLYQAVLDERVTQDGSEVLSRHVEDAAGAQRKVQTVGADPVTVIVPAPGDAAESVIGAQAAAIAYHRSRFHVNAGGEPLFAWA